MAISQMRYRPDTCRCVFIQTHDPTVANSLQTVGVEAKCPAHAGLSDADTITAVNHPTTGENRKKNRIRNRIFEQYGVEIVSWTFAGTGQDRVLTIVTSGLTNNQRNAAQAWADTNIGVGKVVIQ